MSYRALYRKYRPGSFSEVLGQEHITTILKNQVREGRVSHAYLFAGTRGTGKTTTAKILARAVNCLSPVDGEPCEKCTACLHSAGENADIIELDAASNTSVDDMRAILDKVRYTPLELRTKVYIIDEAHALSPNAFNALLKTLEEPPAHVLFILATTEPQRVPATIISRCQRFDFRRIDIADMLECMRSALNKSGAHIDEEGLLTIARAAEGGMRDALSLADQCISFCGSEVSAQDVYRVLGSMDARFMFELGDTLIRGDADGALRAVGRIVVDGRDLRVFVRDLALHMRALLLAKICGPCESMLNCTSDAMGRYIESAKGASEAFLMSAAEALMRAEQQLRYFALPRVLIESTLVRIARPEEKRDLNDVIVRIEQLEKKLQSLEARPAPGPAAKASAAKEPPAAAEAAEPVAAQGNINAHEAAAAHEVAAVQEKPDMAPQAPLPGQGTDDGVIWAEINRRLKADSPPLYMLLQKNTGHGAEGGRYVIWFESKLHFTAFGERKNRELVEGIVRSAAPELGYDVRLRDGNDIEARARALFGDIETID